VVAFGVVGRGFIVSLLTAFVRAVTLLWVIRLGAVPRLASRLKKLEPTDRD
jgi:hypothetical protein